MGGNFGRLNLCSGIVSTCSASCICCFGCINFMTPPIQHTFFLKLYSLLFGVGWSMCTRALPRGRGQVPKRDSFSKGIWYKRGCSMGHYKLGYRNFDLLLFLLHPPPPPPSLVSNVLEMDLEWNLIEIVAHCRSTN